MQLVRRRAAGYHQTRLNGIRELDKIASTMLSLAFSRKRSLTSQPFIQFECVAACLDGDDLWVASNNLPIEATDFDALYYMALLDGYHIAGDMYYVENGHGHMHAEMKLLRELQIKYPGGARPPEAGPYIGVSKPCCGFCKNELDMAGIGYSHYHLDRVVHWEHP